ncbi:MAG TPA: WGR domain-containing protein [Lacunisphaera sp.]|nr:WGR domain-containing protein [Lacunisphaera sp.]
MIQRTFEFSEGTSNKFWTIQVDDKVQTINFGRIGTAGQTQTKEFGSADEAKKVSDKLIAEKVKKGYVEKSAGAPLQAVAPKPSAPPKHAAPAPAPVSPPSTPVTSAPPHPHR